ncbi:hypothetical protein ACE02U_08925 [Shewanella xiamenensis]|uniref:hypothetical protein n=1 Tax=Shewanella xiamenensis TaxID=332186 RepID=UPI0035B6E392
MLRKLNRCRRTLLRRYKLTLLAAGMLFGFLGKLIHLLDYNGDIYAIYLLALLSGLAGCLLFLAFFMDKRDYQEEIARVKEYRNEVNHIRRR